MLISAPVAGLYVCFQRQFIHGMLSGAVKGCDTGPGHMFSNSRPLIRAHRQGRQQQATAGVRHARTELASRQLA